MKTSGYNILKAAQIDYQRGRCVDTYSGIIAAVVFAIAALGLVFGFILSDKQLESLWLQYRDNITDKVSYIKEYRKMVRLITIFMACAGVAMLLIKDGNMQLWFVLFMPILIELCVAPKITSKYKKYKEFKFK